MHDISGGYWTAKRMLGRLFCLWIFFICFWQPALAKTGNHRVYFKAEKEGIYTISNPFGNNQKVFVATEAGYYQPLYIKEKNRFAVYCKPGVYYELSLKTDTLPVLQIAPDTVFKPRNYYQYGLISNFGVYGWFDKIIKPGKPFKDSLYTGLVDPSNGSYITIHAYGLGEDSFPMHISVNDESKNIEVRQPGDLGLGIYVKGNRKYCNIEIQTENSELGIMGYETHILHNRIDYGMPFFSYRLYPGFVPDSKTGFSYYIYKNGILQLTVAPYQLKKDDSATHLLVQQTDLIKEIALRETDVDMPDVKGQLLIVYHNRFAGQIDSLKQSVYDLDNSIKTTAIDAQAIYDRYAYGNRGSAALKKYLIGCGAAYVLLVGDANINERAENDLIPTNYYTHKVLNVISPSDYIYTYDKDQGDPKFSIGRLPFTRPVELSHYIDKLKKYNSLQLAKRAVFVKAGQSSEFEVPELMKDSDSYYFNVSSTNEIISAFSKLNRGAVSNPVIYFGHGAFNGWEDNGKVTSADLEKINSTKPYLLFNFTCWSGDFSNGSRDCFDESMIKSAKGPVASVCPSNFITGSSYQNIIKYYMSSDNNYKNIGQFMVGFRKKLFAEKQINPDDLHDMNLLGIPILKTFSP